MDNLIKSKVMDQLSGTKGAAIIGIIGGMAKYIHLLMMGDTLAITRLIEAGVTAAFCGFMGVLGKQLYKWMGAAVRVHVKPWVKSLFNKNK